MGGLRGFKFAPRMVAAVLKDCGWSGPPAVREALGIDLSARAWKGVQTVAPLCTRI